MGVIIDNNKIIGFFNNGTNRIPNVVQDEIRIEYEYDEDTDTHIYTLKIFPDTDYCLAGRCYIVNEALKYKKYDMLELMIDEQIQKGLMYYEKKMRN